MPGRKLRILQILRAPIGGLFRHVSDLTAGLAALGHDVGVVVDSLASDAQTKVKLDRLAPLATLGIHSFPIPRVFGPSDIATPLAIAKLARDLDIDVLHGHGAKGGFLARSAKLRHKQAVALYTPHGGVLHYKPGSFNGTLFKLLERAMLPLTDAVIFESTFAQKGFVEMIGKPGCRGPVIHNGLARAEFIPVDDVEPLFDFAYVGEFRDLKGVRYLLDALVGLKTPDGRPARLIMAGGGPDLDGCKQRIIELGLSDRVELAGVRPAREIFARGRCVIVPSLAESLPYVVMEATAAGRPVIATRVGGIAEIFGTTADALIPAADTPALAQAMQAFLDHPQTVLAQHQVRLDFVADRFALERMTGEIETLYRDLLAVR